jgi:uncharacterized protein (DUF983 family)
MASIFQSIIGQRCPRCRKGRLFLVRNPYRLKHLQSMPAECPVCGQDFVIEPGFFFGASYVSYALMVGWLIPLFLFIRFVLNLPYSTYLIVFGILLPILVPPIYRFSRTIWIHMFVRYDPVLGRQADKGK